MIMMQTGMVKQGINSACHTFIDGTKQTQPTNVIILEYCALYNAGVKPIYILLKFLPPLSDIL